MWTLQELTHEKDRYRWNILGHYEMRWKNFDNTTTQEGRKVFCSGKEDEHKHGTGFLIHKDIMNNVMGCRPVSSRLITICHPPFNITVVQVYAPTSDYDDNKTEKFHDQLKNVIDQILNKDILVVEEDWNAKVGNDAYENWQDIFGPFCNDDTNERGLRLLELATFNDLCWQKLLVITKHPEDGPDQMDNTTTRLITF